MNGIHQARAEFGRRLRRLREDAGLTGTQLAVLLGWTQSKVSKLETGRQAVTSDDVRAWGSAVGAPTDVLDDLLAELRTVRFEYASWQRWLRSGFAARQRASVGLEAITADFRGLETAIIPGILQTPDYARHVLANNARLRQQGTDIEEGVRIRMRRQEALYDPSKRFRVLLTEAALRNRLCPAPTLAGQLDRLNVLSGLDNVALSVVPFDARLPLTPLHGFWIFDAKLVLVETLAAELSLRDGEDVALYLKVFDQLWALAAHGEGAEALVVNAAQELRMREG